MGRKLGIQIYNRKYTQIKMYFTERLQTDGNLMSLLMKEYLLTD